MWYIYINIYFQAWYINILCVHSHLDLKYRLGRFEDEQIYVNMARDSKGGRDHHPARFKSYIQDPDRLVYVCEFDSKPVSIISKWIHHCLWYQFDNLQPAK